MYELYSDGDNDEVGEDDSEEKLEQIHSSSKVIQMLFCVFPNHVS